MSINIGTLDIGVAFAGDTAGLQKATADAQQGIDRFGASTSKAMRQMREDTQGVEDALGRLSQGFKGAVIGSSVAVGLIKLKNTAIEVGDALIQAQVQLDKLNNGFKFGAGGAAGGARELAFVREEANRLGLEIGGAATQYMKMVAAARGTNMEGEKTRALFTSIAEASTVMGMSGEQSERAMQAVVQMMSKGKVQAEELRGQLGEHLPGAFAIAARAMGVTEVELNKLMETGQVMSADFLPKFAAQLRNELGGSVEDATKSMQASLNRYETAWLTFKQNVAQTGVSEALGGQINILSDAFNGISERMEAARKAGGGFWSQTAAGAGGVAQFLNPINALSYSAISLQGQLEQAKTKLNELEKERPYSGNIFLGPAIEETKQLIAELERAKAARDQLSRQPGTGASEVRYSAIADADAIKAQQAKGYAYAKLMGDMATPQEKFTAAVFAAKKDLGELYSPEVEARLREHFIKPTREAKEKLDELTKSAMRGLELYSDLTATEGGLSKDFSEKWVQLSDARAKDYISAEHLLAAQAALLKQQPFYKKGLDDEEKALKEQAKATDEAAKAYDAYYDAVQKNVDTLQGNIDSENESVAAIGLSAVAIAELEAAKLQDIATTKERTALTWESIDLSGEMTAKLRAEAKALRDLAAAKVNRAVKETAYDEAKQAADAWRKASEQIEKDITDALMRGFESGKGFAEVLRDTVANMFKTLVLRPIVSAIVNPVAGAITGGLGLAGTANAATGAGNLMGAGAGLYNSFATSSVGGSLGLSVPYVDVLGTGAAEAGIMTSAGSSLGAALPWIGGGLAVLSLLKSLDDSGTYHTGGLGSYSAAGGTAVGDAVKNQGLGFDLAAKDYTASSQQAAAALAQSVVGMLDSTANTFGQQAGYYAATAFADDTSKDGAWGALMLKLGDKVLIDWQQGADKWPGREFADGEAGAKEYAAAIASDMRTQLMAQTPGWADAMLQALGSAPTLEQLSATVADINALQAALVSLGQGDLWAQITTGSDTAAAAIRTDLVPWMQRIADASGPTAATLKAIAEYPNKLLALAGTSRDALVAEYTKGLMTGDAATAGQSVANQLVASIEQTMVGSASAQIFDIINRGIVTPMIDAMLTGQSLTAALSQASLDAVVAKATATAQAMGAVLNDPTFAAAMATIRSTVGSSLGTAGGALAYTPQYQVGAPASVAAATTSAASLGDAVADLAQAFKDASSSLSETNQALSIDLMRALGDEMGAQAAERTQYLAGFAQLGEAERDRLGSLYDQNQAIRDQISAIEKQRTASAELRSLIDSAYGSVDRFASSGNARAFKFATLGAKAQEALGGSAADWTASFSAATPEQIKAAVSAFFGLPDASTAAKNAVLGLGNQLLDLSDAADQSAKQLAQSAMATYRAGLTGIIDAAAANTDATSAAFERGIASQRKLAETSKTAAEKLKTEVQGIFDSLQSSVDSLFASTDSTKQYQAAQGQQYIAAALAAARATGALPDGKELSRAITAATGGLDAANYRTQAEADYAKLVLANELRDLQSISGDQLAEAERQVQAAEATLIALDDAAQYARDQLNEARGIKSDTATMAQLLAAIAAESTTRQNVAASALLGTGQSVYSLATQTGANATGQAFTRADAFAAAAPFATGNANDALALYSAAQQSGFSLTQLESIYGMGAGSLETEVAKIEQALGLTLPRFDVGANRIMQDTVAVLHKDEAVLTPKFNPWAGGTLPGYGGVGQGGNNNADLVDALDRLTAQNARLEERLARIETHTDNTATGLGNVTRGNALITKTAEAF